MDKTFGAEFLAGVQETVTGCGCADSIRGRVGLIDLGGGFYLDFAAGEIIDTNA